MKYRISNDTGDAILCEEGIHDLCLLLHTLAHTSTSRGWVNCGGSMRWHTGSGGEEWGVCGGAHTHTRGGYTSAAPELRRSSFLPLDRHRFQDGGRSVVRSRHTYRPILRTTPPLGGPLLLPRSTLSATLTCSSTS